jgi:hypothetical protein
MPYATCIPTIVYLDLPLEAPGGQKQAPTAIFLNSWDVPGVIYCVMYASELLQPLQVLRRGVKMPQEHV